MTDDGGVPPLSFGPQEWKWFLQNRNLGSSSETIQWEINSERPINALQPDVAANCVVPGDVTHGLAWLHRAQFRDLTALKKAAVNANCQQDLLQKKVEQFVEDCSLAEQNWTLLCSALGVGDHVTLETNDISQAIAKWRTVQKDQQQAVQRGLLQQHGEFLQLVQTHCEHLCKRTRQPRIKVANLQQFLIGGSVTNEELRNELHELLAFIQSRRIDCSKQHMPAFMLLVASDDEGMLSSFESGLKRVISDIGAPHSDTMWIVRQLESKQARVVNSRTRLETCRKQLQAVDSEIQALHDNTDKFRKCVESKKLNLEQEIAKLLECEQVQILIEES
jgi:hypothetical protein